MEELAAIFNPEQITIAPLEKQQVRGAFKFEDEERSYGHLIDYFRTNAWPANYERIAKTYVVMFKEQVIGYFTLVVLPVKLTAVRYKTNSDVQALLLGKFYICQAFRSKGIGTKVLDFIIDIGLQLELLVGCRGIIVDANPNT